MNILFIAPYLDLVKTAGETLKDSPYQVKVLLGDLEKGLQIAHDELVRSQVDVIVSRGGTASLLRQNLQIPVFEIDVTAFDLLRVVYPYVKRGSKVAVVGYENVVSGARSLAEILGVELGYFLVQHREKIDSVLDRVKNWGADILIGDTVSITTAQGRNINCELVRSGPEAIRATVEAAARFYDHMHEGIVRSNRLHTILEHTDKGVIYLDSEDTIEIINSKAEKILGVSRYRLTGTKISSDLIPGQIGESVHGKNRNRLIQIDGKDFLLEVSAVRVDGIREATLLFLQSTGYYHDMEGMIRQQLTSRGLIANDTFDSIVARSKIMLKTVERARRFSRTDSTVLLLGETGCGKEIFAQSIHNASPRSDGPFIGVNCAALPDSLLESELFGYAEGAFTGARKGGKPGLFELAHKGTIFLDEVNDMSNAVQARFLRVLQEKKLMRIGDNKIFDIDIRIIAASNKDLLEEAEAGRFRKDLYYRLKILDIEIPPLRKRAEDIVPLFAAFYSTAKNRNSVPVDCISDKLYEVMIQYPWPGNVRQLRNFAEKVAVLTSLEEEREEVYLDLIDELKSEHSTKTYTAAKSTDGEAKTLREIEEEIIRQRWELNDRNVSRTARELGIDRVTLRKKLALK
ncbi:sigma 54-interacting transcriptional regulator [Marispirochaeta aestuarii]|uniref:sigma 54-interacting transcriptional regulator n=1 Tax=Marispirochaeta aestuarii TaxID=1963862 RepID=UPI0029C68671|nr:sigma 54-interacting transcriptional regulator [Marispirochaeta aestuarii]